MAEGLGGYVESLQINADQGAPTANMTIRVPAARLEDAKAEFRKLAIRIDNEQSNASEVTKHMWIRKPAFAICARRKRSISRS